MGSISAWETRGVIELAETDWEALVAAVAENSRVLRSPRQPTGDGRFALMGHFEGAAQRSVVDEAQLKTIEDEIDEFLNALGIPGRPSGFRWFLISDVPLSREEFFSRLNLRTRKDDLHFPSCGKSGVHILRRHVQDILSGSCHDTD